MTFNETYQQYTALLEAGQVVICSWDAILFTLALKLMSDGWKLGKCSRDTNTIQILPEKY